MFESDILCIPANQRLAWVPPSEMSGRSLARNRIYFGTCLSICSIATSFSLLPTRLLTRTRQRPTGFRLLSCYGRRPGGHTDSLRSSRNIPRNTLQSSVSAEDNIVSAGVQLDGGFTRFGCGSCSSCWTMAFCKQKTLVGGTVRIEQWFLRKSSREVPPRQKL